MTSSTLLAQNLADAKCGSFTGLIIRKEGTTRGKGDAKMVYGDDLVHVVIVSGFRYDRLVQRSLDRLNAMDSADLAAEFVARSITDGKGLPVGRASIDEKICDLKASFESTLAGTNESTTDHVYDPLIVNGEVVRGARVYKCVAGDPAHECHCAACTGDEKAPKDGTIYLQGLKVGEKVIEAAVNGAIPGSKSRADVVAKNIIRARLPVGRYVSYRLEIGSDFILRAGGVAAAASDEAGIELRDATVAEIFNVAV